MDANKNAKYAKSFKEQLTPRALIIGALGSIIITTSSMYVALRMGSLPWPTIFVTVLSMTILKALGNTNLNEINVAHTAMSAGGMAAGGLAFTLPGLWMLDKTANVNFLPVLAVTLSGTLLGVIFTALLRKYFIEVEKLKFPMGIASAETVIVGDEGGEKAKKLFIPMGIVAIFTAIRDGFGKIPAQWTSAKLAANNIFFGLWISPMAVGMGYLLGPALTSMWFFGAVFGYFLLIPLGIKFGFFADVAMATAFKDSLGIGITVGTGIGILVKGILPRAKEIYGPIFSGKAMKDGGMNVRFIPIVLAIVVFLLTFLTDMGLVPSLLTILGVWLTTAMAASTTGQTGINPMEIFGILVLLLVKALTKIGMIEAFFVAAVVAIASGLAGDVLNDFKSGHILKTDPNAQLAAELVGGIIGSVVSVIVLFVLIRAYGEMGPGTELLAPQAYAVSTMVGGLPNVPAFIIGIAVGFILFMLNFPSMTLGIGIYLPMMMSTTIFIGGMINLIVSKVKPKLNEDATIVCSGLLGGEGIMGVIIAIIKVITMS